MIASWPCSNEVVREDPTVIDAWFMMGTQYLRHNEPAKAVEYFKRTLSLKPDYDLAVMNLAQAYRRLGDDEAALAGFEHYLKIDPKDPFVHYQMGEIWMDRGDLPRTPSSSSVSRWSSIRTSPRRRTPSASSRSRKVTRRRRTADQRKRSRPRRTSGSPTSISR